MKQKVSSRLKKQGAWSVLLQAEEMRRGKMKEMIILR